MIARLGGTSLAATGVMLRKLGNGPAAEAFSELEEAFFRAGDEGTFIDRYVEDALDDLEPRHDEQKRERASRPASWVRMASATLTRLATEPPRRAEDVAAADDDDGDDDWEWKIAIARARVAVEA